MLYVCDHCSLSLEQNKMVLMTVDAWWRGVCVERVVIAAVISQGSKHILLHDCYLCKKKQKNKVQLKVWSQNSNKLSVSLPVLFVSGAAPGFVSQITTLVFQFLKRVAQVYFWIFFLRKIMNNQEALEKKQAWVDFFFFFCSVHNMWHRTNVRIMHANVKLLLHYRRR